MKKLFFLSLPLLVGIGFILSCNNGPSQAETDYQKLLTMEDSLTQVHQSLQSEHQQLKSEHDQLQQQLQGMANVDSSLLRDMAEQDVILANQEATFQKHQQIMQSNDEFKQKHASGNLSDAEIQAQVDQMRQDQQMMMDENDQIRDELDKIHDTNQNVRDKIHDNNNGNM